MKSPERCSGLFAFRFAENQSWSSAFTSNCSLHRRCHHYFRNVSRGLIQRADGLANRYRVIALLNQDEVVACRCNR